MRDTTTGLDTHSQCPECECHFEVTLAQWSGICKFDTYRIACVECNTQLQWSYPQGKLIAVKQHNVETAKRQVMRRDYKQPERINSNGLLELACGFCGDWCSPHGQVMYTGVYIKRWTVEGKNLMTGATVAVKRSESIPARKAVVCDDCLRLHTQFADSSPVRAKLEVKATRHFGATEYYRPTGVDGTGVGRPDSRSEVAWELHDRTQRKLTRTQERRAQRKATRLKRRQEAR